MEEENRSMVRQGDAVLRVAEEFYRAQAGGGGGRQNDELRLLVEAALSLYRETLRLEMAKPRREWDEDLLTELGSRMATALVLLDSLPPPQQQQQKTK
jgi:hypothetical protein